VALVAVSLSLSGVLTGVLVQNLGIDDARDQLAKGALLLRPQIAALECGNRLNGRCLVTITSEPVFISNVENRVPYLNLAGDRMILLSKPPPRAPHDTRVLYDSGGTLAAGTPVPLGAEKQVSGQVVREGNSVLDGQVYLVAAVPATNKFVVSYILLARPQEVVLQQTRSQFVQPILESAAIALLLASVLALLLGGALTRPLDELRSAAEGIAGGNYSRRVQVAGGDEIGVVARAFNRMAEAVERTRAQQRAFLANVSHELKTPLTSLIGFSQALVDGSLRTDDERMRAATILHEEAERVLRMSQELLDLARVEAGQLTLNLNAVDLGVQLLQEIEIVRARADRRRLALQLTVPPALPPVQADPDRLHQILENLLDNSVKYAPEGTNVWISAQQGPDGRITTSVRNRVGVRPPDPDRMFDRFYRGDPARSSAAGVGLGLAISRELAVAQAGDLRAELHPDGSLSLKLELPAATRPPAQTALPPGRLSARLASRPQLRGS